MALSRPFVLAIIGALLSAATFVSLQSASQNANASDEQSAPVVTGVPAPKPATTTLGKAAKPSAKASTHSTKASPKPVKPKAAKKAPDTGIPPRVKRALQSKAVVVLFFRQPAADDAATAKAVAEIRGKGVKVFSDSISKLSRYRRAVSDLGITQAPAIAIVGKDRKARVIEGYVDGGTLKQAIRDAR